MLWRFDWQAKIGPLILRGFESPLVHQIKTLIFEESQISSCL